MHVTTLHASDDLRHWPKEGEKGRDSLFFNLILPEDELAVFMYTWVDGQGVGGRMVNVWGPGREPMVFEPLFGVPVGDTDFDDWQVGGLTLLQAAPLRTAVLRYEGDDVSIAYRFEATHEAFDYERNAIGCPQWMAENRYEQTGRAQGRLEVDGRTIDFDTLAHRDHSWGRRNWNVPQHWKWIVAQTPDGTALNLFQWVARGEMGTNGYVLRDGETIPLVSARCEAEYDDGMVQTSLRAELVDDRGVTTDLELDCFGNMPIPIGSDTLLNESACRARINGAEGAGQFEAQWARSYLKKLAAEE